MSPSKNVRVSRVGLLLLAVVTVTATLIVVPEPVRAVHTVDTTPTNIATSGYNSDVAVDGNIVAIAYVTSATGALVLTYSTDGGVTWVDRPTSINPSFNRLKVFIIDSDSFTIFYSVYATAVSQEGFFRTTNDGGLNWFTSASPGATTPSTGRCPAGGSGTTVDNVNILSPDGMYANGFWYVTQSERSSSGTIQTYIMRSADGGLSWSMTPGSGDYDDALCNQVPSYSSLHYDSTTGGYQVWARALSGCGGAVGRATFGPWGTTTPTITCINDPVVPLTTFGFGVDVCDDLTCAFFHDATTTGRVMMAVQQPGNINTWYFYEAQAGTVNQIQLKVAQTTDGGSGVLMSYSGGNRWNYKESADLGSSFQSVSAGTTPLAGYNPNGVFGLCGSLWITYVDETTNKLQLYTRDPDDVSSCAAAVDSTTIAATNLIEGDFTGDGTLLIARTENGANVRTYDAIGGDLLGTYATPNCDWQNAYGVSAIFTTNGYYTAFADCDSDATVATANQVDMIRVKDATLSEDNLVTQPPCDWDSGEESTSGDQFDIPFDMNDLGSLNFYPYYSTTIQEGNEDTCILSWTFSTISGEIGAVAVAYLDAEGGGFTNGDRVLVTVNSGQVVGSFCSWHNPNVPVEANADFVAGVSVNGPTVAARIVANFEDGTPSEDTYDDIELTGTIVLTNSGTWSKGNSIDCAGNQAIIKTDAASGNNLFLINVTQANGATGSVQKWAKEVNDISLRSVTISGDSQFAAWTDNTGIIVAHAQNGTVIDTFPTPSGTFKGMEFDRTGGNLAIFTSSQIVVYHLSVITCEEACSPDVDDTDSPIGGCTIGCSSSSTSTSGAGSGSGLPTGGNGFINEGTDSFFGINISYIAGQWGMNESGFRWLLGLYTTILIVGAAVGRREGLIAAMMGAIAGAIAVGICVAFGLFPVWFLLLMILLIVIMAGKLFFGNTDSDGM